MTNLESVANAWAEFNLEGKRPEFDQQGLEIAEQQDAAVKSRQVLATETKNFKKLSDEEKLGSFGNLLKSYQQEVDKLSKRARFSENAFLSLYKSLYELPDCVPSLQAAVSTKLMAEELAQEAQSLRDELSEYSGEIKELRNQDVTVRKWQEKCKDLEKELAETKAKIHHASQVKDEANTVVASMREECDMKLAISRETELELQEQNLKLKGDLSRSKNELMDLQTEVFRVKSLYDEGQSALQSTIDMMSTDIERANATIATLEREKARQSDELADLKLESTRLSAYEELAGKVALLQADVDDKTERLRQSKDALRAMKGEVEELQARHSTELAKRDADSRQTAARIESLEQELRAAPSVEEHADLKRRIQVLEAIQGIDEDDHEVSSMTAGRVLSSVEESLVAKKKALESQLMKSKVVIEDQAKQVAEGAAKLEEVRGELLAQKKLVVSLEEALSKYSGHSGGAGNGEGAAEDKEAKILQEAVSAGVGSRFGAEGGPSVHDQSMLQVIISQRDRFKSRIVDLESENRKLVEREDGREHEIRSLRDDNVKLYEKIRYLKSYGGGKGAPPQADENGMAGSSEGVDLERGVVVDRTEMKYKNLYERKVDPFAAFRGQEKSEEYKKMNVAERTVFTTSTFVLSTKRARMILFVYGCMLHLLVIYTLYSVEHYKCQPRHL